MMRRRALLAAILLGLTSPGLASLAACTAVEPTLDTLVIAGGEEGDVYAALAEGLAGAARDRWSVQTRVLTTAGATENLQLVADGAADVGFATTDAAFQGLNGELAYPGAYQVVSLAGMYDDYLQIVVRADGPVQRLADLSGRRYASGPTGSLTEVAFTRLLSNASLPLAPVQEVLTPQAAAEALVAGRIDAFVVAGGLPTPAVSFVADRIGVRLLSVATEAALVQARFGERYLTRTVPASTYNTTTEAATLGVRTVLVVRPNLSEANAYALTELLFAAKDRLVAAHAEARRLDPRSALDTGPIPLHAGAARYYRETKPLV